MPEAAKNRAAPTHVIAQVLKFGSYGSTLLMAFGVILALVRGFHPVHYDIGAMAAGLFRLDATAVMQAGIALLLLTPVMRVMVAIVSFTAERDWKYALISAAVMLIVLSSIFLRIVG